MNRRCTLPLLAFAAALFLTGCQRFAAHYVLDPRAPVATYTDLKPVAKFENRQKAVKRVWQAVQELAPARNRAPLGRRKPPARPRRPPRDRKSTRLNSSHRT